MKFFFSKFLFGLYVVFLLVSCTTRVDLIVKEDLSAEVDIALQAGDNFVDLLKKVANFSQSIFDEKEIKANLQKAGQENVTVSSPSISSLKVNFFSGDITKVFSQQISQLITVEKTNADTIFKVNLNRALVKQTVELLPDEIPKFMDLLMAPVFTGETISSAEYLDLISVIYGNAIKNDLAKAEVLINITAPKKLKKASISMHELGSVQKNGSTVQIKLSLADLLCIQDNQFVKIVW
ncbi:MAG: hypothetical protein ACRC4W_01950 [Treponemataceae bacterium]